MGRTRRRKPSRPVPPPTRRRVFTAYKTIEVWKLAIIGVVILSIGIGFWLRQRSNTADDAHGTVDTVIVGPGCAADPVGNPLGVPEPGDRCQIVTVRITSGPNTGAVVTINDTTMRPVHRGDDVSVVSTTDPDTGTITFHFHS